MKRYVKSETDAQSEINRFAEEGNSVYEDDLYTDVRNSIAYLMVEDGLTLSSAARKALEYYQTIVGQVVSQFKSTYNMQDDDHVWNL